jgi:hypothetical protein
MKIFHSSKFIGILTCLLLPSFADAYEPIENIDFYRNKSNNDTVAKILNYTEGLEESGSDQSFWYPFDAKECIYRKSKTVEVVQENTIAEKEITEKSQEVITPKMITVLEPNVRELKLNTWTPSTVKVGYIQNAGTWWGPNNYYIQIMANGIPMLESNKPRDIERTQAAWNLVFNRFCPGRKNNF